MLAIRRDSSLYIIRWWRISFIRFLVRIKRSGKKDHHPGRRGIQPLPANPSRCHLRHAWLFRQLFTRPIIPTIKGGFIIINEATFKECDATCAELDSTARQAGREIAFIAREDCYQSLPPVTRQGQPLKKEAADKIFLKEDGSRRLCIIISSLLQNKANYSLHYAETVNNLGSKQMKLREEADRLAPAFPQKVIRFTHKLNKSGCMITSRHARNHGFTSMNRIKAERTSHGVYLNLPSVRTGKNEAGRNYWITCRISQG